MTIKLFLSAEKADFLIRKQGQLFTTKFIKIEDGVLEIDLEFPELILSLVAQELIYTGEDYALSLIKKAINENNLSR